MGTEWYYVEGNDRVGPVTEDEMTALLEQNVLDETSYVWKKGMPSWKKLQEILELSHLLENLSA